MRSIAREQVIFIIAAVHIYQRQRWTGYGEM